MRDSSQLFNVLRSYNWPLNTERRRVDDEVDIAVPVKWKQVAWRSGCKSKWGDFISTASIASLRPPDGEIKGIRFIPLV